MHGQTGQYRQQRLKVITWAMEEELIQVNPMANVKKPKLPNRTVKGLEPEIMKTVKLTLS